MFLYIRSPAILYPSTLFCSPKEAMSLHPLSPSPPTENIIVPYSWVGKILKVPVFRLSLGTDLISRIIIAIYNFFSSLCSSRSFRSFDPAIAERSVDRFVALGAHVQFVTPSDKRGKIQMMTFRAQDLERKIEALGGKWERQSQDTKTRFVIVPPQIQSEQWNALKEQISHFRWKEEGGVIITNEHAEAIPENAQPRCFLYAHSTSGSFASDWKRAGFYIGAKQDLCFFDNGNTWKNSGRTPSEEGFYLEIDAVYEAIQDQYSLDCLWVGGSCGGAPVAAYLKRRLHTQGVNFFVEQSFPDLDDFVKPISPFFAPRIKGCLSDPTFPQEIPPPPTSQFGPAKLWKDLPQDTQGKFILVQVKDDEHIDPQAYERYLALANRVNTKVTHLLYSSAVPWRHADDFFRYQDPSKKFLEAVFR